MRRTSLLQHAQGMRRPRDQWRVTALTLLLVCLLPLTLSAVDHTDDSDSPFIHYHAVPLIPSDPTSSLPPTSSSPSLSPSPPSRRVHGATLAYLTPWHRSGFDLALSHPHLFTLLAPVWFQVKLHRSTSQKHPGRASLTPLITGAHDVDPTWIHSIHSNPHSPSSPPLITPRFILELSPAHLLRLAREPRLQRALIRAILTTASTHHLDGLTLEATDLHAVVARDDPTARPGANDFIAALGAACHAATPRPLTLVLVVRPPFPRSPYFGYADWVEVGGDAVDYVSLMTYDYSAGGGKPGPNAPVGWVKAAVDALLRGEGVKGGEEGEGWREKVLVGINFYGMHWKGEGERGEPVVGSQYEELLRGGGRRVWEGASMEERVEVKGGGVVYYPTSRSLRARVDLINAEGCGMSIWELGQGLPPLLDEL